MTQVLSWFIIVFAVGVIVTSIFVAVAAIVKACRRTAETMEPVTRTMEPVTWIQAFAVTNPDDTTTIAVKSA